MSILSGITVDRLSFKHQNVILQQFVIIVMRPFSTGLETEEELSSDRKVVHLFMQNLTQREINMTHMSEFQWFERSFGTGQVDRCFSTNVLITVFPRYIHSFG